MYSFKNKEARLNLTRMTTFISSKAQIKPWMDKGIQSRFSLS